MRRSYLFILFGYELSKDLGLSHMSITKLNQRNPWLDQQVMAVLLGGQSRLLDHEKLFRANYDHGEGVGRRIW